MRQIVQKYKDVAEYRKRTAMKIVTLAKHLEMSRFRVTALVYPDRYPVDLNDEEVARVARLLNQPIAHVLQVYPRRAA